MLIQFKITFLYFKIYYIYIYIYIYIYVIFYYYDKTIFSITLFFRNHFNSMRGGNRPKQLLQRETFRIHTTKSPGEIIKGIK